MSKSENIQYNNSDSEVKNQRDKNQRDKNLRDKILREIIAFAMAFALIGIVWIKTGIYLETCDDVFISDILRGAITGTPDYHTMHNGVALSWPLMILYKITPNVAWYGIFLVFLKFLSVALPLSAIYACDCKKYLKIIATAIVGLLFFSALYIQSYVQFTSAAMVAAFAGFVCILVDDKKKNIIYFGLLEYLAYCTRPESMEIVQPIGFVLLGGITLGVVHAKRGFGIKEKIVYWAKRIVIPLGISIATIVIGLLLYKVAYSGEEWKEFFSVNEARVIIFDYTGAPEADEISGILSEAGVSEAEYLAYLTYFNYDWDNTNGVIEQVADYAVKNKSAGDSIGQTVKWVLIDSYGEELWALKMLMICTWIICILVIIISRKFSGFISVAAYFCAKILTWGYVYYKGRMPIRLMLPLYHIEIMAAFCIIFSTLLLLKECEKKIDIIARWIIIVATIGVGCLSIRTTKMQYRYLNERVSGREIMARTYNEVSEYCNAYPERSFMLSQYTYSYWSYYFYSTMNLNDNWIYTGGWFGSMPGNTEHVKAYIDEESLFFITSSADVNLDQGKQRQIAYLEAKYNATLVMVDTIDLSTGGYYEVYEVVKN